MSLEYDPRDVPLQVRDARHVPWLSVVLGYGPMLPFVIGALLAWVLAAGPARLAIGFAATVVLDPLAAQQQEAPPLFARLRPLQIPIAVVSLIAILIRL